MKKINWRKLKDHLFYLFIIIVLMIMLLYTGNQADQEVIKCNNQCLSYIDSHCSKQNIYTESYKYLNISSNINITDGRS